MRHIAVMAAVLVGLTAAYGFTQMSHEEMMGAGSSMMGRQAEQQTGEIPAESDYNPYQMVGPGMMGYGMGPGMTGCGGHMMGPGMTGCGGHMMGPGMMGCGGHMMGPGMMGCGGHMMGPGMMGCGMMGCSRSSKEYNAFLDETSSLRKELHMKKFEYSEALRNPDTKRETVIDMEKEMRDIQNQIYKKSLK